MLKLLKRFKWRKRPFVSIQVEPTSICQLKCTMCPKTVYYSEWEHGRMSEDVFQAVSSIFPLVNDVHLQGWGEPLIHPKFFHMVEQAKESGCKVSFTTNGRLLSSKIIDLIIETEVNTVVVSFAGAKRETHEKIRKKSSFHQLKNDILELTERRANLGIKNPSVILSYLMTVENVFELTDFVKLAYELNVNEVVATNLDFPPSISQKQKSLFNQENLSEIKVFIQESEMLAKQLSLKFRYYPIEPKTCIVCELNPLKFVYINWKGDISPCVYLNMPKRGELEQYFLNKEVTIKPIIFGNILQNSFLDIWNTKNYEKFRDSFTTRLKIDREFQTSFRYGLDSINKLKTAEIQFRHKLKENPFPESCHHCYKSLGL